MANASDDDELRAMEAPDDDDGSAVSDAPVFAGDGGRSASRSSGGRPSGAHEPDAGQVVSTAAVVRVNPYGGEDDECCGVCLENPGPGGLISLFCCRNVLCVKDVQLVGVCPFCREEPVMWDIKTRPAVS